MFSIQEIEQSLNNVDPRLCMILAVRCSIRSLPMSIHYGLNGGFNYLGPNKEDSVLAIFLATLVPLYDIGGDFDERSLKNLRFHNIYTRFAEVFLRVGTLFKAKPYSGPYNSVSAVYHAYKAVFVNDDRIVRHSIMAVKSSYLAYSDYAFKNSVSPEYMEDVIENDVNTIVKLNSSQVGGSELNGFLYSSLWMGEIDDVWVSAYGFWKDGLLSLNADFDIWLDWYRDRIKGEPIDIELSKKWLAIPSEIREQGVKATNIYLTSLVSEVNMSPLNLVRAIFIGDGAVGKTSLIRRLHGEKIVQGKEEMTPGIEIKQWQLPDSEVKARFWDFGGQVMSHSMHQFFLRERCLYILLVDAGTEREKRENASANDRAEYWLEHIKAFGNSSPVMLVGNKADKESVNLDMNALREKYPNIIDFYPVSCTSSQQKYLSRFQVFQDDLVERLQQVDTHQVMFTQNQFSMLENLRERSRKSALLDHEAFDGLCLEHEIGKVGLDQKAFLGLLDSLGEIVHFPDLEWSEAYVLNPRWLTYGVYTLLYAEKTEQQSGLLCHSDVVEILQAEKVEDEQGNVLNYPKTKCRFIVDAMSRFGLCYEMGDGTRGKPNYLVIPDRLPKDQPNLTDYFDSKQEGTLAFEFDFDGLLPRSVMPNLIVSRHQEIAEDKAGRQLVWQRGVVLEHKTYQSKARIQVDYIQRRLLLWVQGGELREYLVVLRDEIHRLLKPIKGLTLAENVVLPDAARLERDLFTEYKKETAPYMRLLKEAARRQKQTSSDAGVDYDLSKVMGFIMTEKQQEKAGMNVTVYGNVGAMGGSGNSHIVKGKVITSVEDKQLVTDFQNQLLTLMHYIELYEADFSVKYAAYEELKRISSDLKRINSDDPHRHRRLRQAMTRIKDGTSGALKLGQDIREAETTVTWLMEKAVVVSALLASMPM
ncbi:MAG: COR domain-containing protein [bacterium]